MVYLCPDVHTRFLSPASLLPSPPFFFSSSETVLTDHGITQIFSKTLILHLPLLISSDSELCSLAVNYTKKQTEQNNNNNHLLLLV